jgi:CNT family concentrative nucleoside transporter
MFMEDILRGILGLTILIGVLYLFSHNRKAIDWKLVGIALTMQILFGLAVLKVDFVSNIFDFIGKGFVNVLGFTKEGSTFVFGNLLDINNSGFIFAFQILPTILFFSALSSILYYLGILQRIIYGLAFVMSKVMRLSGAESLAAAANVFIGQTEAPLIVKPYLNRMTKSELLCLMVGGMATIAGGVLAAYIGFLGGDNIEAQQEFARHLLTASIMSAPAAILAAKILYPETEQVDTNLDIPKESIGSNLLEAISNGTTDGLKLAVNVGAMLIVFIALVAMLNSICSATFGEWIGWGVDGGMSFFGSETNIFGGQTVKWNVIDQQWLLFEGAGTESQGVADVSRISLNMYIEQITNNRFPSFNLEFILGVIMAPVAWVLGTPSQDILMIGQLLGKKTIINEFVAYGDIPAISDHITHKSKIIATYALCGFANFASIGIQVGGIGAIAPEKRSTLAELGIKALIGGTIACFMTATIAGMLVG